MNFSPILLYAISVAGLVSLIILISKLVASFTGWIYTNKASAPQAVVNIPKPGRYSVCILRDRFWLNNGESNFSNKFTQCDFSILAMSTSGQVPYHKDFRVQGRGISKTCMIVGYFDAHVSGAYNISHQCPDDFWQNDEIAIRKYFSIIKFYLLTLGIIMSGVLFFAGAIVATLMLVHVI